MIQGVKTYRPSHPRVLRSAGYRQVSIWVNMVIIYQICLLVLGGIMFVKVEGNRFLSPPSDHSIDSRVSFDVIFPIVKESVIDFAEEMHVCEYR